MAMAEEEKGANSTPEKKEGEEAEILSVELPAPAEWTKKFILNEDGTPKRNEIVFISPTGEEIKNKRQLQQYLKAHPGGPSSSEFDWGTGDTPRRSARIRERAKVAETPEDEKPRKRERKSSSKKGTKEKKDDGDSVDEASAGKEDVAAGEAKVPDDAEMKDGDDADKAKDEGIAEGSSVSAEVGADKDTTSKVANEDGGEKGAVLESNGGVQNNGKATLGTDTISSVPETENNKGAEKSADAEILPSNGGNDPKEASADKIVMTEVPSGGYNEGQRLPKASPVNC